MGMEAGGSGALLPCHPVLPPPLPPWWDLNLQAVITASPLTACLFLHLYLPSLLSLSLPSSLSFFLFLLPFLLSAFTEFAQ